ncbi:MAG: hypothetical protein ISS45_09800 [Candidatus Omnitrophica bacterium]|nr:hypothetical protein [Candidatus Omnitrophota bacterium]
MKISIAMFVIVMIGMIYSCITSITSGKANWVGFAIFLALWVIATRLARKGQ